MIEPRLLDDRSRSTAKTLPHLGSWVGNDCDRVTELRREEWHLAMLKSNDHLDRWSSTSESNVEKE